MTGELLKYFSDTRLHALSVKVVLSAKLLLVGVVVRYSVRRSICLSTGSVFDRANDRRSRLGRELM